MKAYKFPGCNEEIAAAVIARIDEGDSESIDDAIRAELSPLMTDEQVEWCDEFEKAFDNDDWEGSDDYPNDGSHDNPNFKANPFLRADGTVFDYPADREWCGGTHWLLPEEQS